MPKSQSSTEFIMDWIIANKEWLFSGIAISIPLAIIGWLLSNRSQKQVQKGGKNSTNIQVGGSMNINSKGKNE